MHCLLQIQLTVYLAPAGRVSYDQQGESLIRTERNSVQNSETIILSYGPGFEPSHAQ